MVPLYLPLMLDEEIQTDGTPIFYNGVNVYLEQKSPLYRNAPQWVHRLVGSARLLKMASSRMGKTNAADVGEITLSMLRGEAVGQIAELRRSLLDYSSRVGEIDVAGTPREDASAQTP